MRIDAKLNLNVPATVKRLGSRFQKAQAFLDNEVIKDCTPYVPMRDGNLYRSAIGSKIGSGKIVYNTPYARRLYYGLGFRFSKDKHPQACAQWFEKAKAVFLRSWINGVSKIVKR